MDGEEESQLIFFTIASFRANTTNSLHIFEGTFFLRCLKLSSQRVPSTCQETFSYTINQTPYNKQGNPTLCENSTCEMNQDAHRIHLTVLRDETVFAEESVYVPAIGESEF